MTSPLSRHRIHPITLQAADAVANGCRTVREVARIVDRAPSTTWWYLVRARELGLVDWQNGSQGQLHAVGISTTRYVNAKVS